MTVLIIYLQLPHMLYVREVLRAFHTSRGTQNAGVSLFGAHYDCRNPPSDRSSIPPPDPSKAKLPKKILSKVDPLDSIPAPRGPKTSLPQKTNIKRLAPHPTASPPPAKVPKPTLQTEKLGAASGPSKSPVATLLPLHGRRASTISPKQALAAVDDLDEFRASMYEIMVAKNQMNFQTKGMFYMVEQQINNIRKVSDLTAQIEIGEGVS